VKLAREQSEQKERMAGDRKKTSHRKSKLRSKIKVDHRAAASSPFSLCARLP